MAKRELIDRKQAVEVVSNGFDRWHMINLLASQESVPTITEQEIAKPLFDEFKKKLSKWMYHNSESVCGDSMIDIDYLEGHIDEMLYEMGIIGEVEE